MEAEGATMQPSLESCVFYREYSKPNLQKLVNFAYKWTVTHLTDHLCEQLHARLPDCIIVWA